MFALAVEKTGNNDAFDELLEKHELWRVLRVGGWIGRFIHNIRTAQKQRVVGPLTTEEIKIRQRSGSSELNSKQIRAGNLKTVYS